MKTPHDILLRPQITEKTTLMREKSNQVVFLVRTDANKSEIKKAIERIYAKEGVKVLAVRTQNHDGKKKRVGKHLGQKSRWKKAIIKLKEGTSIEVFEGV